MDSPLLFPVKLNQDKIVVLDETSLPFKEEYIEINDLGEALEVLKEMKTRSLGQVLLFFYSCCIFKNLSFEEIARKFKEQRPTFDFFMLANILGEELNKGRDTEEAVKDFIENFDRLRRKRAKTLAERLPQSASILTICNINGELIYLYEEMKALNKECIFYVSETRPYLQGTRLTFWELKKNDIAVKLICDNQAARLMKESLVNCVVVGADRATKNGDIINKIGTYSLAILANYFKVPFYVLAQYPRDIHIEDIEIEERSSQEAFMFLRKKDSFPSLYPSFDITKRELIKEVIWL